MLFRAEIKHQYGGKKVTQGDALEYTENTQVFQRFQCQRTILPCHKWRPVEEQPDPEDEQGSFDNLFPENSRPRFLQFGHHKGHGVAYGEEEEREYQVGGRAAVPGRVLQGRVNM